MTFIVCSWLLPPQAQKAEGTHAIILQIPSSSSAPLFSFLCNFSPSFLRHPRILPHMRKIHNAHCASLVQEASASSLCSSPKQTQSRPIICSALAALIGTSLCFTCERDSKREHVCRSSTVRLINTRKAAKSSGCDSCTPRTPLMKCVTERARRRRL